MATPSLEPRSDTSTIVLPSTGTLGDVASAVPFGVYTDSTSDLYSLDFISGAVDQVAYTYKKLGGNILDIELQPCNVYAAYEEAVLEYSYIVNIHQGKNILKDVLGGSTGSFDSDGNLKSGSLSSSLGGTHISLKFPRFTFAHARRIFDKTSTEVRMGGTTPIYSASFNVTASIQDYDLTTIISESASRNSESFFGKVGNKRIMIKEVYYKTPPATWRFFGYYGGLNVVGNLYTYGQYADDSTFQLVPVYENKLQAMAYEDAIYTRNSHYSYELINNKIRIFPEPVEGTQETFWVKFLVQDDAWEDPSGSLDIGLNGINNINTIPFGNIPYDSINSIGKQWIRRFALALSKETLAQVRGKYSSIPFPSNEITLNAAELLEQAKSEQETLREELKGVLDELTYDSLSEQTALQVENANRIAKTIPNLIYVG